MRGRRTDACLRRHHDAAPGQARYHASTGVGTTAITCMEAAQPAASPLDQDQCATADQRGQIAHGVAPVFTLRGCAGHRSMHDFGPLCVAIDAFGVERLWRLRTTYKSEKMPSTGRQFSSRKRGSRTPCRSDCGCKRHARGSATRVRRLAAPGHSRGGPDRKWRRCGQLARSALNGRQTA